MKRSGILLAAFPLLAFLVFGCGGGKKEEAGRANLMDPPLTEAASDSARRMSLILAWVGDVPITGEDVYEHMQATTSPENAIRYLNNPDIVQVALNGLLDQFVWGQVAEQAGYELTPHEQRRLLAKKAEYLASRYVADVVEKKAMPTREEVEEAYNESQANLLLPVRVAARHILVKTEDEARSLLERARNGEDFVDLVHKYSIDDLTKDLGGALGFIQENGEILGVGKSSAFEKAVLPLKPGEMTVVQSKLGWHVVKAEKREGGGITPLDDVYDKIAQELVQRRFGAIYNEALAQAREATNARYEQANFEQFTGAKANVERLMQMAGDHPDPAGRVELYRRVSFDFSDSKFAPEAQFMIGYIQIKELKNAAAASKALRRLQEKYPDSDWRKAGDWLMDHMRNPKAIPTPEEIFRVATGAGE